MGSEQKIEKFLISFELTEPAYPGLAAKIPISQKVIFSNVTNPQTRTGSFTPNNDYLYLAQNIPADKSPNFFYLICTGQCNITMAGPQGYTMQANPILKSMLWLIPKTNTFPITGIYIEGRTANIPMPMAQGAPIDYYCLYGQADLS